MECESRWLDHALGCRSQDTLLLQCRHTLNAPNSGCLLEGNVVSYTQAGYVTVPNLGSFQQEGPELWPLSPRAKTAPLKSGSFYQPFLYRL